MARSFVELDPIKCKLPVGFPLILMSFAVLWGSQGWEGLVVPVMIFHTVLALAAILMIGFAARLLTGSGRVSFAAAAALWTVHPCFLYAALIRTSNALFCLCHDG